MKSTRVRHAVEFLILLAMTARADAQTAEMRATTLKRVAQAAAPTVDRKVPFSPGEVLTYDVSWSSYMTAGVATMAVKEERRSGGSSAYYIVAEAKTTGLLSKLYSVYYKADTLLDSRTLLPQRGSIYSQEGNRRRTRITTFDHVAQHAEYEVKTATNVTTSVGLARYAQDVLSAFYALRAVPLRENSRMTMPVCDGGKMYRVQLSIGKTEPVRVGRTSLPAFRVTPTIADAKGALVGRSMTLWISADARQLPLRLQADLAVGSINLTMRNAPQ